jgi:flagellum-specific peptidoglycan hydrolase FlgJ
LKVVVKNARRSFGRDIEGQKDFYFYNLGAVTVGDGPGGTGLSIACNGCDDSMNVLYALLQKVRGAADEAAKKAKVLTTQGQLTAENIQAIVTKSTAGQFASPLAEKTLSEFLVAESSKTGVPLWLVLAQAKRETSFGSPQNGTVQDGRTFEDGTKGNAHNLFNIRPGSSWTGKKLDLGLGSGEFRVYGSYQDSVRDYMRLMSSSLYKGQTLHGLVYRYFPPSDNGGSASTERYIDSIIDFAASQGITITRDTVIVH